MINYRSYLLTLLASIMVPFMAVASPSSEQLQATTNNTKQVLTDKDFPYPDETYATMVTSVSSDGHYAVTSNLHHQVILWDLIHHDYKIISNHANTYSAYFIKHSPYFMWQSLPNGVPLLKLGISSGQPPADKLKLVANHKLGIVSKENNHFYFYFPGNKPSSIEKKENPDTINSHYLIYNNIKVGGEYFSTFKYDPKFIIDPDLTARYRFLKVIMDLGYHSGNIVHVQDPSGHEVLHFDNFPVYGQVMRANFKDYFASTFNWNLYQGYGNNQKMIMIDNGGFYIGKLLNLTLANKLPLLLSSGDSNGYILQPLRTGPKEITDNFESGPGISYLRGITVWDTTTGQPIQKFNGLYFKSFATFSPDGNYIIAGDENLNMIVWSTKNFKQLFQLNQDYDVFHAPSYIPNHAYAEYKNTLQTTLNFVFVDKTHYVWFSESYPLGVVLYDIHSPKPIKFLPLGNIPPGVFAYDEDSAIDSSPSAHILVAPLSGRRGGIIVYHYDPKTMSLKRIWIGKLNYPASAFYTNTESNAKSRSKSHWLHSWF